MVEQYSAKKVYPSTINIKIKPAKRIAVKNDDTKIFIGSNGKLIFDENMKKELPILCGEFNSKKFLEFRNVIKNSDFQFSDFKSIVFYVSKRWDIKTNNNILIKLPEKDIPEALKNAFMILKNNKLEINRVIDLRIPNRIIKQ